MPHPLRWTIAAFAALAIAAPALADDAAAPSLPVPGRAFEFAIQGSSLGPFDGATVSYRRQTSAHRAWRFGLTIAANTDHRTGDGIDDSALDPRFETASQYDQSEYGASLTRLASATTTSAIHPYIGIGIEGGWRDARSDSQRRYLDAGGVVTDETRVSDHLWGPWGGAFLLVGAEWVVSPRIAVHAEYGEGAQYSAGKYESTWYSFFSGTPAQNRNEAGDDKKWTIAGRGAHAGVSVFY